MLVGWVASALTVGLVVLAVALHWPWWLRASLFFPAALAATGFLQATRRTCIARASEGTFENDDFSTTRAADEEVAASRKVAATIKRDALIIGLASAAFGALTSFLA